MYAYCMSVSNQLFHSEPALKKWLNLHLTCEMGIILDRSNMGQNEVRDTVLNSPTYSLDEILANSIEEP